tara:strand:- start:25 stop:816 length:792 start_codon:yes stop_codon:yes gene_type:complete
MCNPVAQFGYSALTSVGDYMAQRQATTAANRARLLNFREDNKKYYRDVILNNVRWKNGLLDSDIAYANLFQQASESWRQQDLAVQQAESQHAENTIQALTELARKEYAGTQTGVTASRLANEGPRQVGFALTKSMRQLMMTKDTASLNKEITAADANRRRRKIFQDSWRSPVHGHTPLAPVLESGPSLGLLVAKLGVAALGTVGKDWFKGPKPDVLEDTSKIGATQTAIEQSYQVPLKEFASGTTLQPWQIKGPDVLGDMTTF